MASPSTAWVPFTSQSQSLAAASTPTPALTTIKATPTPPPISSSSRSKTRSFFFFFYASVYTLLLLLLLALLLVTPADVIRQAVEHQQFYNVIIIGVAYVVTVLVVAFIYATRLYITRSIIASIPRGSLILGVSSQSNSTTHTYGRGTGGTGDVKVKPDVRKAVDWDLSRCAAIAWDAKPRPPTYSIRERRGSVGDGGTPARRTNDLVAVASKDRTSISEIGTISNNTSLFIYNDKANQASDTQGTSFPFHRSVWGPISHPGWSGPDSIDLPNLQYATVLTELPHLIEAKALTLAPLIQTDIDGNGVFLPDLNVQASLQRQSECMGLRDYLYLLIRLGVLPSLPQHDNDEESRDAHAIVASFLSAYERARYSTRPMSEVQFRELMHLFAELLRQFRPMSSFPYHITDSHSGSDIDDPIPISRSPSVSISVASSFRTHSSDASCLHH